MLRRARGFNLTELMVALVLGLTLLAGFLVLVQRCQREFTRHESLARLQDAARNAMSVLASDIEHAGFFGFARPPRVRAPAALPAGAHDCGVGFAIDLATPVEAVNNRYPAQARDCEPTAAAGGARTGADVLTLRYASLETRVPHAGRIQLHARRLTSQDDADLFADGRAPTTEPDAEIRDVEVRTYYIANSSVERPGWPALRVKALTESRGAAQFRDEEVQPGVEDLQVELAVRTGEGNAQRIRYVPPESPALRTGRVVAVRLWLRLRSDGTERGYSDSRPLAYADQAFMPSPFEAQQRRMLVERTIWLRNGT